MISISFIRISLSLKRAALPVIFCFLIGPAWAADYRTQANSRFIIQFTERDKASADELREKTEEVRARIIGDIGRDFPGKTTIIIAPTIETFQRLGPGLPWIPLWAAGAAFPEHNLIIIRSPRAIQRGHIDLLAVFTHEFTHVALGIALRDTPVPVWLAEGLAMYEAREWTFERTMVLIKAVLAGRLIPLKVLAESFPLEESEAELAYAESFMFISFLINNMGRDVFHRFILDYSHSGDLRGSLRRTAGLSLEGLEQRWLLYLKLRVSWIPILTSTGALWFIVSLIFLYGYFRKRRLVMAKLRQWEEAEAQQEKQAQTGS
ncbi:MAG: hypothetical protein L7F78_08815 [Syntrophales bacterium LBB04]|nr:hypothetical protein [Syntrophales bacterium LBB04]